MGQKKDQLSRRNFTKLSVAALGGALAGTYLSGCTSEDSTAGTPDTPESAKPKHLCRGLNECKGQGATGKNECAGQGDCATIAHHDCGTKNDCKGLGGCGETVGKNECKGKGNCAIPLMDKAWDTARKDFEAKMKTAGTPVGAAPAK